MIFIEIFCGIPLIGKDCLELLFNTMQIIPQDLLHQYCWVECHWLSATEVSHPREVDNRKQTPSYPTTWHWSLNCWGVRLLIRKSMVQDMDLASFFFFFLQEPSFNVASLHPCASVGTLNIILLRTYLCEGQITLASPRRGGGWNNHSLSFKCYIAYCIKTGWAEWFVCHFISHIYTNKAWNISVTQDTQHNTHNFNIISSS